MVSQISFKGTYKVSFSNQDPDSFLRFQKYSQNKELEDGVKTVFEDKIIKKGNFGNFDYKAEQTLIVPDYMDCDVEKFCAYNGISFKKLNTKDLQKPESILSRIKYAPKGYKKVYIDAKKLQELAQTQMSNLSYCKKDYEKYYTDSIDTIIKSGNDIPASTLYIHIPSGNEDLQYYIDRFGVKNLNNNQILINFSQKTNSPDHCVFYALEDMGINKIPVYLNNESYKAGQILGLF